MADTQSALPLEPPEPSMSRLSPEHINPREEHASSSRGAPYMRESAPTSGALVWKHLTATIKPTLLAEIELIFLTILTGIQDAVSFPDYHCFASNQTGNTVFLMIAIVMPDSGGDMFITANIGAALGFFLAGGWLTGQLGHIAGPRCRLFLVVCNLLQAALVLIAGTLQHIHGVAVEGSQAISVISLLAFAAGSQVVQSRSLAMTEISTAMATAAWVDLLIDKQLFARSNRPRTRRVLFLLALASGALLGAAIYRTIGSPPAIIVSGAGKAVVAFMLLFNEAEKGKKEDAVV